MWVMISPSMSAEKHEADCRRNESRETYVCLADRVFDGLGVRDEVGVLVRGEYIEAVLPEARLPRNVPVLNLPGCTMIPGLIDSHVHFMRWQGPFYLANGVTTIRDTGNELDWILARRAEWETRAWPRILCVGPMLDGPQSGWGISRCCTDMDSSAQAIRELATRGVDGVKLYAGFPGEWVPSAVAAAHAAGLKVCMHCVSADMLDAAAAGVDELFHLDGLMERLWPGHPPGWLELWGDPHVSEALGRQMEAADSISRSGAVITPTLSYYRSRTGPTEDLDQLPEAVRRWFLDVSDRPSEPDKIEKWRRALSSVQGFVHLLADRGAPVLAGTDVPWVLPGSSMWTELALLSDSGLGPLGALRSATWENSKHLGLPKLGLLKPGRRADIAFVKGDPTQAIPERPDIPLVIRGGKAHKTSLLIDEAAEENADPASDPWGAELIRRSKAMKNGR